MSDTLPLKRSQRFISEFATEALNDGLDIAVNEGERLTLNVYANPETGGIFEIDFVGESEPEPASIIAFRRACAVIAAGGFFELVLEGRGQSIRKGKLFFCRTAASIADVELRIQGSISELERK